MTIVNEGTFNKNVYLGLDFWFGHEPGSYFSADVQGLRPNSPGLSLDDWLVALHHGFLRGGGECWSVDLWGPRMGAAPVGVGSEHVLLLTTVIEPLARDKRFLPHLCPTIGFSPGNLLHDLSSNPSSPATQRSTQRSYSFCTLPPNSTLKPVALQNTFGPS